MIIDFVQNRDSVEISYVNDKGKIEVEEILMEPGSIDNGFYKIVETTEDDPDSMENLKSFYGNPVKKEQANYFGGLNMNEFISYGIKERRPLIYDNIMMLKEPFPYAVDIETEITDEYGYSTAEKAENRILSISVTNNRLDTILFIIKNPDYEIPADGLCEEDAMYVDAILQNALGNYYMYGGENRNKALSHKVKVFETEAEMLVSFVAAVNKYFHMIMGWNLYDYDLTYIFNRCKKLGIDYKKMSPVNSLSPKKNSVNISLEVPIEYPKHRMAIDYMNIFKGSELYRNLDNFSLDYCSEVVLDLHKITYKGNLRTLYQTDYLRFIAYALVDTILVMLLNNETNLLSTYFFQSYYTQLPYMKLNQNPISLSLVYRELRNRGRFMCDNEFPNKVYRSYIGAFVKTPTKHDINSCMGEDFGSLYPNSMISCFLSFDNKIPDTIEMDDYGHPINEFNRKKFEKYKEDGCCITPMGRIYKADPNNIYTSIEKGLLSERKIYKKAKEDIYLNIMPKIEEEIRRRKSQK